MTYAIETELGRFEADTEKDAKKLLRTAMKEQAKKDTENAANYQQAKYRAYQQAYNIYERHGRLEPFPPGWRIKDVGSEWAVSVEQNSNCEREYTIRTSDGDAKARPYDPIVRYLENGSGYCTAVAIANQDCELFAIGTFGGMVAWIPLYGITLAQFRFGGRFVKE